MPLVSNMTDNEVNAQRAIRERIKIVEGRLDKMLADWKERDDRILTPDQIDILSYIADHCIRGTPMTPGQRQMKTEVHQKLRNGLCDIERMIDYELMGAQTRYNPYPFFGVKSQLPFDPEKIWREDFPAERVCKFVACLVEMFGDEYAYRLTKAIEDGLRSRKENKDFTIEVRPVKYLKSTFEIERLMYEHDRKVERRKEIERRQAGTGTL